MDARNSEVRRLSRLEKKYGPLLCYALGRAPTCWEDPGRMATRVFKAFLAQQAVRRQIEGSRFRWPAKRKELKELYIVARDQLLEHYQENCARCPERSQVVEELKKRVLACVKKDRDTLLAALTKLEGVQAEVFLLTLSSKYCGCDPVTCLHDLTHQKVAEALQLSGRNRARVLWRTGRGRVAAEMRSAADGPGGDAE